MTCSLKDSTTVADGKTYPRSLLRLHAHPDFSLLRETWYPLGKKSIPFPLILDSLAIAVWYCDDGSNVVSARRISLATYCFSRAEVQMLSEQLDTRFNIRCYVNKKNVLIVRTESYKDFIELVRPYVPWACFQHKLAYRASQASPSCKKDISSVLSLYQSGHSVQQIAAHLGVSPVSVYNQLQQNRHRLQWHQPGLALNNKSGIKGVCFDKSRNKWLAFRSITGKYINLGRFTTRSEAETAVQVSLSTPLSNT
jgi:hypothetical protein